MKDLFLKECKEKWLNLFCSYFGLNYTITILNGLRSFAVACFLLIPKDVNKL